jgi:UDP-3-O-[3-hydroxymyristoyl] glucosamine N-acyltransferase
MKSSKQYTLGELVQGLDVTVQGDPHCVITGVSPIQASLPGHITFLTNSLYRKYLPETQASAVILSDADAATCKTNIVVTPNPYYVYAKVAAYFSEQPDVVVGVHPTSVMAASSVIDPTASIGPHVVIGERVQIGARVVIGAGTVIGNDCSIGESSRLDANVTVYHHVTIGKRAHISSGVVIGSDGFGIAPHEGAWHHVPQLGGVDIGDDVDVGANTSIDRGALENTIIENGVKLDNLIQVAHNVKIGAHTVIAGCVAIAGSTTIGAHCIIGGASCFAGHMTIADGVMVTGMTAVTKSIDAPGMYSSGIVGAVPTHEFRKNNARFHRLENLMQRVKTLESAIKEITERKDA